jgi:membrane protein YqaA with SNARE-associated domain
MENNPIVSQSQQVKIKAGPKDVFLHLLAIITLYVSAGALINLLFSYIGIAIPDALDGYDTYNSTWRYDSMRFDVAILIVVFPAYLFASWLLNKGYTANPERRKIWVRKWLIYLTLFLSALILIGDLVALVNGLLRGELTTAFILKVLSVFVVIGGIFLYYFWDMRKHAAD